MYRIVVPYAQKDARFLFEKKIGQIPGAGWGYYNISKVMEDSNTVQEEATYMMCDSNTFSYVRPLFLMALQISLT